MAIRVPSRTNQRRYGYVDRSITTLYAGCAEIISPESGEIVTTNTPTFSWAPVEGATSYNFYIWEDGEAEPLPVNTTETSYTPTLEYATTYRWRVNPVNDFGETSGCTFGQDVMLAEGKSASIEVNVSSTVSLSSSSYTVTAGEDAVITVIRQGSNGAASVNYQTSNGTATAPDDYTATSGTLEWADGDEADKQFLVPTSEQEAAPEYSNDVLFPWDTDGSDPRSCLNDHEYLYDAPGAGGNTGWTTYAIAKAAAEAFEGYSLSDTIIGWSRRNQFLIAPYDSVSIDEDEILDLRLNHAIIDTVAANKFFGEITGFPPAISGFSPLYHVGVEPDEYVWWSGVALEDGYNVSGVYYIASAGAGGVPTTPSSAAWIGLNNCNPAGGCPYTESGNPFYSLFRMNDVIIQCRRKIRAPVEPCLPRCEDPYPDYELDSNYCVIDDVPVKRGPWVSTAGNWKVLALYRVVSGAVDTYPLNPALPEGHPDYNNQTFWSNARDEAILAGYTVPATYSASGTGGVTTYPRFVSAAYVRDAAEFPGNFTVSLSSAVGAAIISPSSATVTIEP